MKLALTGVLQDGSPLRPGVPPDARANISIQRGVDLTLVVTVVRPSGQPVDMTGATLTWTIKKRPLWRHPRISKTATIAGNVGTFTLSGADVRLMDPGLYSYDVWLLLGGKNDPVIPLSPFQLLASVTDVP